MKASLRNGLLVFVIVLIVGSIWYLEAQKPQRVVLEPENLDTSSLVEEGPVATLDAEGQGMTLEEKERRFVKAPELSGISGYLNADENLTLESLRGKVVIVDFWTYSCINCVRTLPYLVSWDEKYRDEGLVIIGVHTPEFDFEKKRENVLEAVEKHGILYPVVQDNSYATWSAYKNRYWPRKYLVDKDGFIRYDHIGEGGYEQTERQIQELLGELGADAHETLTAENVSGGFLERTPELYAGFEFAIPRGQNIGNAGGLRSKQTFTYELPDTLEEDVIYLEGEWKSTQDSLELIGDSGAIVLDFIGKEVNIVADYSESSPVQVLLDGAFFQTVTVSSPDVYRLYQGNHTNAVMTIQVQKGFVFHAFTFG